MVLKGETIKTGASPVCPDCDKVLTLQVCKSHAGYYVGTMCYCGPYSRESRYFPYAYQAEEALKSGAYSR